MTHDMHRLSMWTWLLPGQNYSSLAFFEEAVLPCALQRRKEGRKDT